MDEVFENATMKRHSRLVEIANEIKSRELPIYYSIFLRDAIFEGEEGEKVLESLKESGLIYIYVGIETIAENVYKLFHKTDTLRKSLESLHTLVEQDICFYVGYMMFNPFTTLDEIKEGVDFLLEFNQAVELRHLKSRLLLVPDAPLTFETQKWGLLEENDSLVNPTGYRFYDPRVEILYDYAQRLGNGDYNEFEKLINRLDMAFSVIQRRHKEENSHELNSFSDYYNNLKKEVGICNAKYFLKLVESSELNNLNEDIFQVINNQYIKELKIDDTSKELREKGIEFLEQFPKLEKSIGNIVG